MHIGIINAMHKEHEQLAALLDACHTEGGERFALTQGRYGPLRLTLMESGIGKVNAAVGCTELIRSCMPDAIVNTGVAGGIDPSLRVMDVVAGERTAYHDVDCGPECPKGCVQGMPASFAADPRLLATALRVKAEARVRAGLICTGDQFITDAAQLRDIKSRYPEALAVDMESAAIAQVCHIYGIPFLSFRIVSDTPGTEKHFDQYLNFWDTMAERSFGVTRALLDSLAGQA